MIRMSNPHVLKRPRRSDDEDDEDDADREVNMDFDVDNGDFQDMDRMVDREVGSVEWRHQPSDWQTRMWCTVRFYLLSRASGMG